MCMWCKIRNHLLCSNSFCKCCPDAVPGDQSNNHVWKSRLKGHKKADCSYLKCWIGICINSIIRFDHYKSRITFAQKRTLDGFTDIWGAKKVVDCIAWSQGRGNTSRIKSWWFFLQIWELVISILRFSETPAPNILNHSAYVFASGLMILRCNLVQIQMNPIGTKK